MGSIRTGIPLANDPLAGPVHNPFKPALWICGSVSRVKGAAAKMSLAGFCFHYISAPEHWNLEITMFAPLKGGLPLKKTIESMEFVQRGGRVKPKIQKMLS